MQVGCATEAATPWHGLPAAAVFDRLETSPAGLEDHEARKRLLEHGPNELHDDERRSLLGLLLSQFRNLLVMLLLAAAVLALVVGEAADAVAIFAILLLNAVIGCIQDYRAERAIEALKAMAAPTATVMRGGQRLNLPAGGLVPGDVVLLEAGAIVPSDVRLFEAAALKIDEAALTGESVPVEKQVGAIEEPVPAVGDRSNMAYRAPSSHTGAASA
jgi:Ca2+-transporting ATPase